MSDYAVMTILETGSESMPLPEIILPENIKEERAAGIENLLTNPPAVDCIHVLGRSGTLAATDLYEDGEVENRFNLPNLFAVDGIGNEVWLEWQNWMRAQGREDEIPEEGIGYFAPEEDRAGFTEWVLSQDSATVRNTVASLRALPSHLRNISILDDISQSGSVAVGVVPALYKAAYGDDFEYDPNNNRYLLRSPDWIDKIILESFGEGLDKRQREFLIEVAKGNSDWPGFAAFDSENIRSLDQIARYSAIEYLGFASKDIPPETVYKLIEKYGLNLFKLHLQIKAALKSHTKEVIG